MRSRRTPRAVVGYRKRQGVLLCRQNTQSASLECFMLLPGDYCWLREKTIALIESLNLRRQNLATSGAATVVERLRLNPHIAHSPNDVIRSVRTRFHRN